MTATEVRRAPIRGLRRWYAVLAGIAWWMVHLVGEAALVRASCLHPDLRWAMHALTAITALGTALAIVWSAQMLLADGTDPSGAESSGSGRHRATVAAAASEEGADLLSRQRFLGLFGVAVGALSLLLIVWEGSYVLVLSSCASY